MGWNLWQILDSSAWENSFYNLLYEFYAILLPGRTVVLKGIIMSTGISKIDWNNNSCLSLRQDGSLKLLLK